MTDSVNGKRAKRNTHPLLQGRLAASSNGWSIIPVNKKDAPPRGWPAMACSADAILSHELWRGLKYMGTAVRIVDQLCVVDSDVSISHVADMVQAALENLDPDAYANAMIRDSGAVTLAVFYRTEQPPRHSHYVTHAYTAHPELLPELEATRSMPVTSEEEDEARTQQLRAVMRKLEPQKVEFYAAGARGRYFCYEGPHSPGRVYRCWEQSPVNTRVTDLPAFPGDPAVFIDMCDKILGEQLIRIPEAERASGGVAYDLKPDTKFYPKGGHADMIERLTEGLLPGPDHGIRGCLPWTRASRSEANCKLFVSMTGRTVVTDWSHDGLTHYMETDQPQPAFEFDDDTRAVLQDAMPPQPPPQPQPQPQPVRRRARSFYTLELTDNPADNYVRAVNWMAQELAFCAAANKGKGGVFSLWPGGQWRENPLTLTSLRTLVQSFAIVNEGPQGGLHVRSPVDAWLTGNVRNLDDTQRFEARLRAVSVDGRRFRPDLDDAVMQDGASRYINAYSPPDHPAEGGNTAVFHAFMCHLIPSPEERALVWQWIAFKIQRPWEPMFTLLMAAPDTFGTGRGTLGVILSRLLGEEYYQEVDFDELTGRSAAARWTAAATANKLLIMVHEAAGDEEGHRLAVRTSGYERLKLMLDSDSESLRTREAKGEMPYQQRSATSCIISTNHNNPIRMPSGERRLAVVRNGAKRMTPQQRETVRSWARDPSNIGALWRELRSVDVAKFDPQEPPMGEAKSEMIELSKTDIDLAWELARKSIKGKLFTSSQVIDLMILLTDLERHGQWEHVARRRMTTWAFWLRGSANDSREMFDGKRQVVYALTPADRRAFANRVPAVIEAELKKTEEGTTVTSVTKDVEKYAMLRSNLRVVPGGRQGDDHE